jgi:hypothetical protein
MRIGDLYDHHHHKRFRILALCSRTGEAVLERVGTSFGRELVRVAEMVPERGWTPVPPVAEAR